MNVVVIGGGPAGISAALQACELGVDVTLLEAERVGGTSVNRGPAPVRTLARAARLVRDWSSWEQFGLHGSPPTIDLAAVLGNSARVGIEAPKSLPVYREEIWAAVKEENEASARAEADSMPRPAPDAGARV